MPDQTHPAEADPHAGATPEPARKDPMSEANYAKLQSDYEKLRQRYRTLKADHEKLTADHNALAGQHEEALELLSSTEDEIAAVIAEKVGEVEAERDKFKQMAESSPDQWKAKYEELQDTLRVRSHQDTFNETAKAAGVLPDALADAWALSGYTPEGDQPDAALIKTSVEGLLKSRPWLKQAGNAADAAKANPDGSSAAPDGATPAPSPASKGKGPGMERGASPGGSQAAHLRVTRAQASDPAWMAANREAIAQASQAGTFSIVEG